MLDIEDALTHLSSPPPAPLQGASDSAVRLAIGAPLHEIARSRAAQAVGALSMRAGLFLARYEQRVRMPLPEHWGRDEQPQWVDGVLPEPKYGAFRHDLPIGTFHAGHRAKWTAHELCHRLVGTAWHPGASPLFIATASRLAELLPVVLWYFLDEIGLQRCELHSGPLFRGFCADCDQAAQRGPRPIEGEALRRAEISIRDAARFMEEELAAIRETRALGRPVSHVWGSLDLCSDGLAYAASHGPRLGSEAMIRFSERFLSPGAPTILCETLEQLEQRVIDVFRAITLGAPLQVEGSAERWALWDVAQRILEVHEQCEGEAAEELLSQVDALADGEAIAAVVERYRDLFAEYDVPAPEDVFGVGYDIEGLDPVATRASHQIAAGLGTVVPLTMTLAKDAGVDLVAEFVRADVADRSPLGVRFAAWLSRRLPGPVADLAIYESALRHASGDPASASLGAGVGPLRLRPGARALACSFDIVRLAERVDAGEVAGVKQSSEGGLEGVTIEALEGGDLGGGPGSGLVIGRDAEGQLVIAEVDPEDIASILEDPERLRAEIREELLDLGLLSHSRWEIV